MTTTDEKAKIHEILKDFSTAVFITRDTSGEPTARPMHVASLEDQSDDMWFFTRRSGSLASEISREWQVLLVFQDGESKFASLRGQAKVVDDQPRIHQFWKEPYKAWFPGGPNDPEIALVRVEPIEAEYWDNSGLNKLRYMFQAAKAYVKGKTPEVKEGEQHGKAYL